VWLRVPPEGLVLPALVPQLAIGHLLGEPMKLIRAEMSAGIFYSGCDVFADPISTSGLGLVTSKVWLTLRLSAHEPTLATKNVWERTFQATRVAVDRTGVTDPAKPQRVSCRETP
jgi:hypothetical protein